MINTVLIVALILFCISAYVFILVRFTKVDKALKLFGSEAHSSNVHWQKVFDNLNPAKQIYPIHFDERQVIELKANMSVTRDMEEFATYDEIADELIKDISKQLIPYVEVIIDKDIRSMTTNYTAKLRVLLKK